MTRRTFIQKMKRQGFHLERDGNSWYLTKDVSADVSMTLFMRRQSFTSSDDDFRRLHVREWCKFSVFDKKANACRIGGDYDFLPFSMVDEYIAFFNKLHKQLKEIQIK